MLRTEKITVFELEVRAALQELYEKCKINMLHSGDLLLCDQNGFLFNNNPCVGFGDDGLNNLGKINSISYNGIGATVDDDNYFLNYNTDFFNGTNELSTSIRDEKNIYLDIWENVFFLRKLTQVTNTLNGVGYDWFLDISNLPPNGKSKHIREQIIHRLNLAPKFCDIIKTAYNGQVRNAIAHSQYHCIKGGIIYDNYNRDPYSTLQGSSFEQWEERYIKTYLIFIGVFSFLQQVNKEFYLPMSHKISVGGIPIRVSNNRGDVYETFLYPNKDGSIWRFTKI